MSLASPRVHRINAITYFNVLPTTYLPARDFNCNGTASIAMSANSGDETTQAKPETATIAVKNYLPSKEDKKANLSGQVELRQLPGDYEAFSSPSHDD
jgi:hypothetical protein